MSGAAYDGRAAGYDALIGARWYNVLAWGTDPADYTAFAREAVGSAEGPLLEIAAGTAVATAALYRESRRPITVTDQSGDMLDLARKRIGSVGVRFAQADAFAPPFAPSSFDTVLSLGFLHMVDDVDGYVFALRGLLRPGGALYLTSLVAESRRGAAYLRLLHRAGEVAAPRTADQLADLLGTRVWAKGCMAYAVLSDGRTRLTP